MFDQIEKMIKGYAQEVISSSTAIPNDKNEAATEAASSSIIDVLKQKVSSGDMTSLLNSFKDEGSIKETSTEISSNFAQKLGGLGINMDSAKNIAMSLIPLIMSKFSQSSGASGLNVQELLKQFGGKGEGFDLSTITDMLGQNGDKGNEKGNEGGLLGKLKNFF